MKMRRPTTLGAIVLALVLGSCSGGPPEELEPVTISREILGQTITVDGRAVDQKIGAVLEGDGFSLWIAGLSRWPEGYWSMDQPGRRVRVTGVLSEDYGLPVFTVDTSRSITSDDPIPQGILIPAPPERDVVEGKPSDEDEPLIQPAPAFAPQRHRYLLEEATWEPLED